MKTFSQEPRFVLVTRKTQLEVLLERHGTRGQAQFFLERRGQRLDEIEDAHTRLFDALHQVEAAIPADRRRTHLERELLHRFLFAPDDVVLIVGQDGLVPNAAKYLRGQFVFGINPDPRRYDGVLCRHAPSRFPGFLDWLAGAGGPFAVEERSMAEAKREDGQSLVALNELFVGHATHQSARYRLRLGSSTEHQSSSGLIVSTGTGATGWARSVAEQRGLEAELPAPQERRLIFFVREPFPSVSTGTTLDVGQIEDTPLVLESEMGEAGLVFADGIEADSLEFLTGHRLEIGLAAFTLRLVVPA